MHFHIITLFPEAFTSYLNESILARAIREKKVKVSFYNPRDFAKITKIQKGKDKPYKRVDDIPYGGGPGMVIQALPVVEALESALKKIKNQKSKTKNKYTKSKIIFLSPGGKQFDTDYAKNVAQKYSDIIIISGRYEGIDERVNKIFSGPASGGKTEKITVGPFVLTGGELPAMLIMDSVSRQIEGVLGNKASLEEERISSSEVYTRPEVLVYKKKKYVVPKVLLSGNHKLIDEWRKGIK